MSGSWRDRKHFPPVICICSSGNKKKEIFHLCCTSLIISEGVGVGMGVCVSFTVLALSHSPASRKEVYVQAETTVISNTLPPASTIIVSLLRILTHILTHTHTYTHIHIHINMHSFVSNEVFLVMRLIEKKIEISSYTLKETRLQEQQDQHRSLKARTWKPSKREKEKKRNVHVCICSSVEGRKDTIYEKD